MLFSIALLNYQRIPEGIRIEHFVFFGYVLAKYQTLRNMGEMELLHGHEVQRSSLVFSN